MKKRISRREFLQQAAVSASLVGVGTMLVSCRFGSGPGKETPAPPDQTHPVVKEPIETTPPVPAVRPEQMRLKLITREDPAYESLRQGFNRRVQKHPKVIALCRSTEEISEAVRYAGENRLPIAIKSGGHSFEGFSSNEGGLVIDLSGWNTVEWLDKTTVKIGPGCTLSILYDTLLPRKRILPAGSCGGVGVGGLALGGGYGFFSRKYGLTCDSLQEVTVVDGSGAVHHSKDDPELLWACRGGGCGNFGVVSEMVFQTHPAPEHFQSFRFKVPHIEAARAESILKHWFESAFKLPEACFSAFVLNGNSLYILVTTFEGQTTELKNTLDTLRSLTDTSSIGAPREPASALKVFYGEGAPIYFKNASAGLYKGFEDIQGCIRQVLEIVTHRPGLIYQVNTLGGRIADPGFESASCYPHRAYSFLSELQSYWNVPGKEASLLEKWREVQKLFRENGVKAQYVNYPDLEFENWETAYYGANYPRLQAVKRKYDSKNRFRYEQSVKG